MPWSQEQIAVVDEASFAPSAVGYHRDDVERMRLRAATAMRRGKPLPDLDAMPLRRTARDGVSPAQVDGLRTLLAVWAAVTVIEDPAVTAQRERDEALARFAQRDAAEMPRWSHEQMDRVREKRFTLLGRTSTSYDEHDVDDYLDSVVVAMRRGIEIPDPAHARFDSAGLRRGYDPKEVDDFLEEIATMRPEG